MKPLLPMEAPKCLTQFRNPQCDFHTCPATALCVRMTLNRYWQPKQGPGEVKRG